MSAAAPPPHVRRALRLRGTVQGIGLRPALFRLAHAHELSGFVRNDADGCLVEVEGASEAVARFTHRMAQLAASLGQLEGLESLELTPLRDEGFRVEESDLDGAVALRLSLVPPDLAPCEACLREMNDPAERRFGYPFTACTACGPRYTVVEALPYDRARTTLAPFPLCAACSREYEDPSDRRFHAEGIACPACGPTMTLLVKNAPLARGHEALDEAARLLREGAIVAVKGVGGYALACDACDEQVVSTLRERKRRPHKPFAIMARDLDQAWRVGVLSEAARESLSSAERPIVLVPTQASSPLAPSVAPGLADVGVFLPPSPLQHLLLQAGPTLQVMTSGNVSDEPLAKDDDEALSRLTGIADAFLLHDRRIHARADDSVVRAMAGGVTPVRRARGFVPRALPLPVSGPPVLALGGDLKSTLCLAREGRALLSPHLGDLGHPEAFALFRDTAKELLERSGERPVAIAHDLHPEYRSTRFGHDLGLPLVGVQHHHAHVASVLVEHGRQGPVIGLAFDGTGYGGDGSLWGGEALVAGLVESRRVVHLRPLALVGGERAIREPWRIALAALMDAGEPLDVLSALVEPERLRRAAELLESGIPAPKTAGAGRWFDAAAVLCGLCPEVSYEGQAAAELEALAGVLAVEPYEISQGGTPAEGAPVVIDLRPAVRSLVRDLRHGVPASLVAARFHETLAYAALRMALCARGMGAPSVAALTGGCFQNRLLSERVGALLEEAGFEVLRHRQVPCGDGGISLGQAAVATARLGQKDGAACASGSPVR